jgi:methyl acetate hydrolase
VYSSLMAQRLPSPDAISRALRAAVERSDAPAVVGLVVSPSAELYREAFGLANVAAGTPVTADAIFRVYSMTKPVASVAAMMLVEEKRLGLDDPIAKLLPEKDAMQAVITVDSVGHFVSRPPATPVTVRHLLTHTSGIAYDFASDVVHRVRESAPSIPETSILVHEPGERWTYGPSTRLLGYIVAKVSGQSLDVFFEERIFKPLGMADTAFTVPEAKRARLVTSHERKGNALVEQKIPEKITPQVFGDYGLYSTASDYGRFLRMILNGGALDGRRVLAEATVKEMSTNQIGALTVQAATGANPGAGRDGFGLGFQVTKLATPDPRHRSNGSISWSGAMSTFFWIDPARHLGAVLLMQTLPFGDAPAMRVLDEFESAVYGSLK